MTFRRLTAEGLGEGNREAWVYDELILSLQIFLYDDIYGNIIYIHVRLPWPSQF